ncbi:hypothetical protein HPP92_016171 [Vanilla planifolia]|uniref:Pentatricopeptide repeat-containing protein n=1 Tax=Vanilla planifolia TaxID=51239 RepID=A0A835QJH8_VANPL|nr:hypothetical protein HPP92_016772 [Vanilla planifolia]KAG0471625.1 hypothetical protein HPP92_016171 [Vanilla planifolia]
MRNSTNVASVFQSFNLSVRIPLLSKQEISRRNLEIGFFSRVGNLDAARQLFDGMSKRDVVSWNAIITAHWQNNDFLESKKLFECMPKRNIISWNTMIAGCLRNGLVDEAFRYFIKMPDRNVASWNAMISGFVRFDRMDEAEKLYEEMHNRNVISYTVMVDGFARNGKMNRARKLFDMMPERNAVSWAAMISGEGKVETARKLFEGICHKDIVSWNAMISGYSHNGFGEEVLKLEIRMMEEGLRPDHATLIAVLTTCSTLCLLQRGRQIHVISIKYGLESDVSLSNALMNMYSKCGSIYDSELIFQTMRSRDLVSWNTIIAAFAQHGLYQKVLSFFRDMDATEFIPNGVTFLSLLSACGHAGKGRDVGESL